MSLPVISIAQMREWEKATWATGQSETEVIRRVGQASPNSAAHHEIRRPDSHPVRQRPQRRRRAFSPGAPGRAAGGGA